VRSAEKCYKKIQREASRECGQKRRLLLGWLQEQHNELGGLHIRRSSLMEQRHRTHDLQRVLSRGNGAKTLDNIGSITSYRSLSQAMQKQRISSAKMHAKLHTSTPKE
jgi:hypothetical protein